MIGRRIIFLIVVVLLLPQYVSDVFGATSSSTSGATIDSEVNMNSADNTRADSTAGANANLTFSPNYGGSIYESEPNMPSFPLPNNHMGVLQPYYGGKASEKVVTVGKSYRNRLTNQQLNSLATDCKVEQTGWAEVDDLGYVDLLLEYPEGYDVQEIDYVNLYADENTPLIGELACGILAAKRKSGTNAVLIYASPKLATIGNMKKHGLGGALESILLSALHSNNLLLGGSMDYGRGKSESWVDENQLIKIVGFNNFTPAPPKPPVQTIKQTPPPPADPGLIVMEELVNIYFEFDKYNIEYQQQRVNAIAETLYRNWEQMKMNNSYGIFVGSTDIRGPEGYNEVLGKNRANQAAIEAGRILVRKGIPPHEIIDRLFIKSIGERFPQSEVHDENRCVMFGIGDKQLTIKGSIPEPLKDAYIGRRP